MINGPLAAHTLAHQRPTLWPASSPLFGPPIGSLPPQYGIHWLVWLAALYFIDWLEGIMGNLCKNGRFNSINGRFNSIDGRFNSI